MLVLKKMANDFFLPSLNSLGFLGRTTRTHMFRSLAGEYIWAP